MGKAGGCLVPSFRGVTPRYVDFIDFIDFLSILSILSIFYRFYWFYRFYRLYRFYWFFVDFTCFVGFFDFLTNFAYFQRLFNQFDWYMRQKRNKWSRLDGYFLNANILLVLLKTSRMRKRYSPARILVRMSFNKLEMGPYALRVADPSHLRDRLNPCRHFHPRHPICIRRGFQNDVCAWEVLF